MSIYSLIKGTLQVIEPYQPVIAAGLIVGKLGWRLYKQKPLNREIKTLNNDIQQLSWIIRTDPAHPLREGLERKVAELRVEYAEKVWQKSAAVLTFGQIPSLFFAHPGANVYQTAHQLLGRGIQMHQVANPVRPTPSRIATYAGLAGGIISMVGTTASFGRMAGIIALNNPISHVFSGLAIGVHVLEGTLMGIEMVRKALTPQQNHAQQVG